MVAATEAVMEARPLEALPTRLAAKAGAVPLLMGGTLLMPVGEAVVSGRWATWKVTAAIRHLEEMGETRHSIEARHPAAHLAGVVEPQMPGLLRVVETGGYVLQGV